MINAQWNAHGLHNLRRRRRQAGIRKHRLQICLNQLWYMQLQREAAEAKAVAQKREELRIQREEMRAQRSSRHQVWNAVRGFFRLKSG